MKSVFVTLASLMILTSCASEVNKQHLRIEILNLENAFQKMANEKSLAEAFYLFADDHAVIKRENDTLIMGKENIKAYYEQERYQDVELTWRPDFVEISDAGDMAYTYGKYVWKSKGKNDNVKEHTGVFHTVWKKQPNKTWKYVWD
ncbi:MAG: nuclear transport factor 2 family protein [Cyclobacteriaceae bacterium]